MIKQAMLTALLISAAPLTANAQPWSIDPNQTSATLPPSIAGDAIQIAAVSCGEGELMFEVGAGLAVNAGASGSAAAITVDGAAFPTRAEQLAHAAVVIIPLAAMPALKGGSRMTVSYPGYERTVQSTFALTGSGKALSALERACGLSSAQTAASAPAAGTTATGGSSAAVQRLQAAMAEELLPECRSYGGKSVTFEADALTTTGDPAEPDIIFDFHHILCNGASFSTVVTGVGYCGAGPCLQRRFSYTGGRYVEAPSYYR